MMTIGVVAIGRNEGERLRACLHSVMGQAGTVVYVDSGSTDGSMEMAGRNGAIVVHLDMQRPFTAARARNEGLRRLMEVAPGTQLVQFVDGDCEVDGRWIQSARTFLQDRPDIAAVCGRRRERYPDASVYNLLCDVSWGSGVVSGEIRYCGGDALMRVDALTQVGGFREGLVAGEEPELCIRLRAARWHIWQLDSPMTLHDAAMTRFSQWWTRCVRTGYAYAEGVSLHGAPPERHWVRESRSSWFWGAALPLAVLVSLPLVGPAALLALLAYPLQMLRLHVMGHGSPRQRALQATFLVVGKFAEAIGQVKFHLNRLAGRRATLIEYK